MRNHYSVPGLSKGIKLVELLCDEPRPLGLAEICQKLALNNHMGLRLLQTLVREGWVLQEGDPAKYRMSLRPFHHVSKPLHRTDLVDAAAVPLKQLWGDSGESVGVGIIDDDRFMYVLHLNGVRDISISGRVGTRYLLHCSAPGKQLLAHADTALVQRIVKEGLPAVTPNTITRPEHFRKELEQIRRQGYAMDTEEYAQGCLCMSVPLFDHAGRVIAALNMSVLTFHYTPRKLFQELGPRIVETGRRISLALGHVAQEDLA